MAIELQSQQRTTTDLEERPDSETQPVLLSLDLSDGNTVVRTFRQRFRCNSKASIFYVAGSLVVLFLVALVVSSTSWRHGGPPPITPPDEYAVALKKALLFFDAQMSGVLPSSHRIRWRENSATEDGKFVTPRGLQGGYYDAGDNVKITFTIAHSMTLLTWSVIEYRHKYVSINEYHHVRQIIRWGADYLMRTFDSSSGSIKKIYTQVGKVASDGDTYDDLCWERPEDIDYVRRPVISDSAPETAAEMAAALAASSIIFSDDRNYSRKLIDEAMSLFYFATNSGRRPSPISEDERYRSSGFHDEYLWASSLMYYATGNSRFLSLATDKGIAQNAGVFQRYSHLRVFSWDNKLPGVALLMRRLRVFLNPGYPSEDMLRIYYDISADNACSYLRQFDVFNYTRGGMIILNPGARRHLQYVASTAFIASLFADYLSAEKVPVWKCGPQYINVDELRKFSRSQMQYILGANPSNYSFLVGYGTKFPLHVHHRAASIPLDGHRYNCSSGRVWLYTSNPNPYNITGAMVGGPDSNDIFHNIRGQPDYTEPSLVGNAALVAALAATSTSGGSTVDMNTIFQNVPPMNPVSPAPPAPWKPNV